MAAKTRPAPAAGPAPGRHGACGSAGGGREELARHSAARQGAGLNRRRAGKQLQQDKESLHLPRKSSSTWQIRRSGFALFTSPSELPSILNARSAVERPTRGPRLRESKAQAIEEFHFPSHCTSVLKRLPEITKPANGTLLPPAAISMPANLTLVLLAPILRETPGGGPLAYARRPSSPSLHHRPDRDARLEIDLAGASAFGSNSMDLEDDQSRGPIYCDGSSLLEPGIRRLPCAIDFLEKAPKAAK